MLVSGTAVRRMGRANPVWSLRCGICPRIFQKVAGRISSLTSSVRLSAIPRGLCLAVRFGAGLAAGGALAAAALSRAERRPDMFVCSLTFREGVGRSRQWLEVVRFHRIAEARRAARVRLMPGPSHWGEKTAPARIPRRGER